MTFVICTGGIDLSVGGQVALIGTTGAILLADNISIVVVVLIMLLLGSVVEQ